MPTGIGGSVKRRTLEVLLKCESKQGGNVSEHQQGGEVSGRFQMFLRCSGKPVILRDSE
jgi:hypothetical protein